MLMWKEWEGREGRQEETKYDVEYNNNSYTCRNIEPSDYRPITDTSSLSIDDLHWYVISVNTSEAFIRDLHLYVVSVDTS